MRARGDPRGFLGVGLESYGYLLGASLWGTAAGFLAIFVELPLLVVQRGATVASGAVFAAVTLLCSMAFIRVRQSKLARIAAASDLTEVRVAMRRSSRRQRFVTWLYLVSSIYLGIPGLVLALNTADHAGERVASIVLCLAAAACGWMGIRHLRRLKEKPSG